MYLKRVLEVLEVEMKQGEKKGIELKKYFEEIEKEDNEVEGQDNQKESSDIEEIIRKHWGKVY